jgi:hypothetical protein
VGRAIECVSGFDFHGVREPGAVDEFPGGERNYRYLQFCHILVAVDDVGCLFYANIVHHIDIHRLADDVSSGGCGREYRRGPARRQDVEGVG